MRLKPNARREAGSALPLVLIFAVLGLLVLTSLLGWVTSEGKIAQRRLQNQVSGGAAEAATELVIGQIIRDFQNGGSNTVDANLTSYRGMTPAQLAATYSFSSTLGDGNPMGVQRRVTWALTNFQSASPGLLGRAATYRVMCQAQSLGTVASAPSLVAQDLQLAYLPLFEFGIFYGPDLEICPGANWRITGRVHSNGYLYCQPSAATVTFADYTEATRQVLQTKSPSDPVVRSAGSVVFSKGSVGDVKSLNLPIATNNSPVFLHQLIEIPPASESVSSPLGQQRYYNNADLIFLVSDTNNIAMSGAYNNFSVSVPWSQIQTFVNISLWLYDMRENAVVYLTQIDLNGFQSKYAYLTSVLGRPVKTLYVADLRTASGYEMGVRLINGSSLPAAGLTVATLNPLYVQGHYNVPASARGTTNTLNTVPASLVADAITVLSGSWNDNRSYYPLSYRTAANTTVNAAVLSGFVPSDDDYYSGGAENAIRLLENWSSRTLTFNGSLTMLFYSQIASAPWGASASVYNPPTRAFNFDQNFSNQAKLPPNTPQVRTTVRLKWMDAAPTS